MIQPGWYPDPTIPGTLRYFDGASWTEHVQPSPPTQPQPINVQQVGQQVVADPNLGAVGATHFAAQPPQAVNPGAYHAAPPQQVQVNQVVVAQGNRKSPGLAVLLAFLFGPLGMLYSTVSGAIVMFVLNVLFIWTLGLFYLVSVPAGMIWAYIAANKTNDVGGIPSINVSQAPVAPQQVAPQQMAPQYPAPPPQLAQPQVLQPQLPQPPAQQVGDPATEPFAVEPPRPAQTNDHQRPDGRAYGDW